MKFKVWIKPLIFLLVGITFLGFVTSCGKSRSTGWSGVTGKEEELTSSPKSLAVENVSYNNIMDLYFENYQSFTEDSFTNYLYHVSSYIMSNEYESNSDPTFLELFLIRVMRNTDFPIEPFYICESELDYKISLYYFLSKEGRVEDYLSLGQEIVEEYENDDRKCFWGGDEPRLFEIKYFSFHEGD